MRWLRVLSESDCYLRCHGDRTGTVDLVRFAGHQGSADPAELIGALGFSPPAPASPGDAERLLAEQPLEPPAQAA